MRLLMVCIAVAAAVVCACEGPGSFLPKSGGRPYEVLVVSAGGGVGLLLDSVLSQDAPGLPQSEPMFDVSVTDSSRFNQTARLVRNIVIVNIDAGVFTVSGVRYEKNVWAKPQMVVYVNAPSVAELRGRISVIGRQVAGLLSRAETNAELARLNAGSNVKAGAAVASMFGYSLKVPADMKSSKKGRNFIWLSDNAPGGMQNICVYSYSGDTIVPAVALAVRDSVMKTNIPGERDGMYMQTSANTVTYAMASEKGRRFMVSRGLWEMHGDAMGGPFVSHSVLDTANRRIVVAEAFVYAPETKKRNLIRQAEAALYTLKKTGE